MDFGYWMKNCYLCCIYYRWTFPPQRQFFIQIGFPIRKCKKTRRKKFLSQKNKEKKFLSHKLQHYNIEKSGKL